MTAITLASEMIATLPVGHPGLYNPWRETCVHDTPDNGPEARTERLAAHLDCPHPRALLIGEAPGYQGCRYSGVAFTSERLLLEGAIPRIAAPAGRLTTRLLPFSEPSATIVWKTLYAQGLAESVILWNAVQLHPHRLDAHWTNRTPTPEEVALGRPGLEVLRAAFPEVPILAVGQKAAWLLEAMGLPVAAVLRHPANGGATAFRAGLAEWNGGAGQYPCPKISSK